MRSTTTRINNPLNYAGTNAHTFSPRLASPGITDGRRPVANISSSNSNALGSLDAATSARLQQLAARGVTHQAMNKQQTDAEDADTSNRNISGRQSGTGKAHTRSALSGRSLLRPVQEVRDVTDGVTQSIASVGADGKTARNVLVALIALYSFMSVKEGGVKTFGENKRSIFTWIDAFFGCFIAFLIINQARRMY